MNGIADAFTLADGLTLWADGSDTGVTQPIIEHRYELNELDFLARVVSPGAAVVDLGAHVGAYALRLARLVGPTGRVTAVEPCLAHVEWLRRSVTANGFDEWTTVVHAAASDRNGTATLSVPRGSSSAHACLAADVAADAETVAAVRLDDVVSGAVHCLKVDIEGAEGLALRGARRMLSRDKPILLVELHPHRLPVVSEETPASLIAWMAAAGFECRLLGAGTPGPVIADTPTNGVTAVVFLPK